MIRDICICVREIKDRLSPPSEETLLKRETRIQNKIKRIFARAEERSKIYRKSTRIRKMKAERNLLDLRY